MSKIFSQNPDLNKIYFDIMQWSSALRNAYSDFYRHKDGETKQILVVDFNIIYPLVTPRDNKEPLPYLNPHDYFCNALLRGLANYRRLSGITMCYSPFTIIELMDQISHRRDYIERVLSSKNEKESYKNITSILNQVPSHNRDVETAIDGIIDQVSSQQLVQKLADLKQIINNKVLQSLFDLIDPSLFQRSLPPKDVFSATVSELRPFRRESSGRDPLDAEMHRAIDAFTVLLVRNLNREDNYREYYYLGQDRLRRAFGKDEDRLSRDIMTPFLIWKSLTEAPSDRDIREEVLARVGTHNQ